MTKFFVHDEKIFMKNDTVNTFVETKKLQLKQSKCVAIHIGKKAKSCPDLKVHGEKMHKDESVKYLGDIVHKSGKAKVNMKERQVKAYAIVAEIISSRRIMYLQHILSRKSSELIN